MFKLETNSKCSKEMDDLISLELRMIVCVIYIHGKTFGLVFNPSELELFRAIRKSVFKPFGIIPNESVKQSIPINTNQSELVFI